MSRGEWKYVTHRQMEVRPDQSGDDDVYQVSTAGTLVCHLPLTQGKSTGVTA